MPFQFRFAALLQLHRRHRDEAGIAVGKANQAIGRIDVEMTQLAERRRQLRNQSSGSRVGEISVDRVLAHGRFDSVLLADLHSLRETRGQLEQELQRRKQVLIQAEIEVKRYERLEEKDRRGYVESQQRREQAELDEAASVRFEMGRRTR